MAQNALAIQVDTRQLDQFAKELTRMGSSVPAEANKAVGLTANEGIRFIAEKTPKITGTLRRSFQAIKIADMVWRIRTVIKYFMFIEIGERNDPRFGKVYRRKGPARMMANAVSKIEKRLDFNIGQAIERLVRKK